MGLFPKLASRWNKKHSKSRSDSSRYFHHGHNRLMLEQLEDRTLLSGNPYTDFITTFESNLNGQVTNLL